MEYKLKLNRLKFKGFNVIFNMEGYVRSDQYKDYRPRVRIVMLFDNGVETRRMPLVITRENPKGDTFSFTTKYRYSLDELFWKTRKTHRSFSVKFLIYFGTECEECAVVDTSNVIIEGLDIYYKCGFKDREITFDYIPELVVKLPKPVTAVLTAIRNICTCIVAIALIPWWTLEVLFTLLGAGSLASRSTSRNILKMYVGHLSARVESVTGVIVNRLWIKQTIISLVCKFTKLQRVKPNKIAFISARNKDMSLNFSLVRDALAAKGKYDLVFYTYTKALEEMSLKEIIKMNKALATSKVILLEEYTPAINTVKFRKGTSVIQLWHAAGAFKVGGFARLGKPGGSLQTHVGHRYYDYVTVSSTFSKYCHAEGFGLSDNCVVPIGVARTDIFFDEAYKEKQKKEFYSRFPAFADKKIIMFAPTFRGDNRSGAFYPFERFDIRQLMERLGDDYALIVKHHPFVKKRHPIPEEYADRVIDLSEGYDINDLLFVTDILISDYSSVIYEASLLNIPMLFYTYDYSDYVIDRDFYFDLKLLSPGKLVYSQDELTEAIKNEDFQMDNMEQFKEIFFDHLDGKSTERIVELIERTMS